jgi:hypothetical protein
MDDVPNFPHPIKITTIDPIKVNGQPDLSNCPPFVIHQAITFLSSARAAKSFYSTAESNPNDNSFSFVGTPVSTSHPLAS